MCTWLITTNNNTHTLYMYTKKLFQLLMQGLEYTESNLEKFSPIFLIRASYTHLVSKRYSTSMHPFKEISLATEISMSNLGSRCNDTS